MFNKLVLSINLLITSPLSLNIHIEILQFFELNDNVAVFCSKDVDEKIAQALLPYTHNEKKEYDAILFASFEEMELRVLQLKAGGRGIMIAPYGTDAQSCKTLKQLGMKIVHKEMHRELLNNYEIERVHLIFFEKSTTY